MSSKGATIAHGIGANALGDPRAALAWLANFLGQRGECIPAMSIIMTVGLSRAHAAQEGDTVTGEFTLLNIVSAIF